MIRFRATQTWPPPSDVWRFASSGATQPIVSENILSRIPGNYVAEALITLPPAESANDGTIMDRFVTVPGVGKVRITARRMKYKRGGSMHYFWTAESAVLIETSERE